jgi:hypothetical protein
VRLWDVSSARTTKQIHLLYKVDTSHPITSCSYFDSHRAIITDFGIFPIPPQHRPPCAADDLLLPAPETTLRLRDDSWIWWVGGTSDRRVCWLPPAYRRRNLTFNENIAISRDTVVLATESGQLAVLKFDK